MLTGANSDEIYQGHMYRFFSMQWFPFQDAIKPSLLAIGFFHPVFATEDLLIVEVGFLEEVGEELMRTVCV